jgi:hypothetical protein
MSGICDELYAQMKRLCDLDLTIEERQGRTFLALAEHIRDEINRASNRLHPRPASRRGADSEPRRS